MIKLRTITPACFYEHLYRIYFYVTWGNKLRTTLFNQEYTKTSMDHINVLGPSKDLKYVLGFLALTENAKQSKLCISSAYEQVTRNPRT